MKETLMRCLRAVLVGCFVFGLIASPSLGRGEDKKASNKEKIIGTWELVKTTARGGAPPGTIVEFTKDGKLKITVTEGGMKLNLEGTYSVEGDTLKTAMKTSDGKEATDTDTIIKLTDKELFLKDTKDQKTELKKKQ
jgi:uncharacterized protein (TIGR03066 family)